MPVVLPALRLAPDPAGGGILLSDGETALPLTLSLLGPEPPLTAEGPFLAVGYFRRDGAPSLEALTLPGCDAPLPLLPVRAKRFLLIALLLAAGAFLCLAALR